MRRRIDLWAKLLVLGVVAGGLLGCNGGGDTVRLTGSGASFPFPLYERWFKEYTEAHDGVRINYQKKGSGAGIRDFTNGIVDFAASDAAMTDDEIAQIEGGVVLLPMTAGKIVLAFNLEGVEVLQLPRSVYPKIFLGEIDRWDHPEIAAANPEVDLPAEPITVVVRADSSGTSFVFSQHLGDISPEFAAGPGVGKTVQWPTAENFIKAPGNDGVAAQIKRIPGSIGYIEYGFAKFTGLHMAELENAAGNFVAPSLSSGQAALSGVEMPADMRLWITNPQGAEAYPIVTYTWLLCYQDYEDDQKAAVLKNVIAWCLTEGQKMSDELGYIPLPDDVAAAVMEKAQTIE